jgi:uncharacterized membrane protein
MSDPIIDPELAEKIRRQPLSREVLYALARHGNPSEEEAAQAFQDAGMPPDPAWALRWLSRFGAGAGMSLLLSGVVFFFAYNWADLHKFAKFGLVGGLLLLAGLFTLSRPPRTLAWQLGLTALVVITGVLLALIGQTYQSGANAYDFFLAWTALSLVWVGASRFPPLWLLLLVLLDTTVVLYAVQVRRIGSEGSLLLLLAFLHALSWAGWEWQALRKEPLHAPRWMPRLLGLACLVSLAIPALIGIYEYSPLRLLALVLWIGLCAGMFLFYQQRIRDLFMLALVMLSGLVLLDTLFLKVVVETRAESAAVFLLASLITLALTVWSINLLMKINAQWKREEVDRT